MIKIDLGDWVIYEVKYYNLVPTAITIQHKGCNLWVMGYNNEVDHTKCTECKTTIPKDVRVIFRLVGELNDKKE